jgi:5'-methylthioadenosine phosphorylase
MDKVTIAVIGGTGVYDVEALQDVKEVRVSTPFGDPSDAITIGTLNGVRVAFLPRHGRGHRILPTEVNSRANIYALKTLGVERVISVSACGSLRDDIAPRHVVIPDQIFDHTRARGPYTFFGRGIVGHIGFAEPFCPHLSALLGEAVAQAGGTVHRGGTFITIEGPRFSTQGESRIYRQWGCDIIGMTAVPEAQLAREAEMCYATMAHVTDYDVWHETEETVSVAMLIENLQANAALVKQAIATVLPTIPAARPCECGSALNMAIVTQPDLIPPQVKEELNPIIGKYI